MQVKFNKSERKGIVRYYGHFNKDITIIFTVEYGLIGMYVSKTEVMLPDKIVEVDTTHKIKELVRDAGNFPESFEIDIAFDDFGIMIERNL